MKTLKEVYGMSDGRKITAKELRKIIMEEFRILREQEDGEKPAEDGGGLVDINAGPDAVLAAASKLDQSVLKAGQTDGAPDDEAFQIKGDTVKASDLEPTQSQIGTGQSLLDQAGDKYGNLDRAIKGGMLASKQGEFPILVYGNKILDGHHRWSQFVTTNPDAMVRVARLEAPGVDDADGALGLAHLINFALYGQSPTKPFEGENVYGMDKAAIKQMALDNMAETTPKKLADAGLIEKPDAESAAEHFADNLSKINGPGDHPRTSMPQAGDAGDPTGLTVTPDEVAKGVVNYRNPKPSDVKNQSESVSNNKDKLIMERWRRLAGLL